jgi:hypothetical protein
MLKITIFSSLLAVTLFSNAQNTVKIGFRLAPTTNIATVDDVDGTPSAVKYEADGFTQKERNVAGAGVSFYIDYYLSKNLAFSSGLWFTAKNFEVRNTDGNYSGVSRYNSTYLQIPILFKFISNEIAPKLKIYVTFGPTIDLRMSEKVVGNDYAHYWNMSRHLTYNDQSRGRNASGKVVKLFNPFDITLFASTGVTYEVVDKLDLYAGIMFNKGFVNLINPNLRFAEPNQTKVNSDISWKAFLVGLELGVAYKIQ